GRWGARPPPLEPMAADGSRDTVRTTVLVEAVTDPPRVGTPATCTAAQIVQLVAVACADPAAAGRPVRHGTPRAGAAAVRQRGLGATIRTRRGGRFFTSGGWAAPSGRGRAQRHAG